MAETLLRPNVRALYVGMIVPGAIAIVGLALALGPGRDVGWVWGVGWGLVALGALGVPAMLWNSRQPRIAYENGHLLLNMRGDGPIRLPVELVQCAFLGAGSTQLPGPGGRAIRTSNLVIRLDEKATEWSEVVVKPALGRWSEGYITIYGTWCEPLTFELVQHLNQRLHDLAQAERVSGEPGAMETRQ